MQSLFEAYLQATFINTINTTIWNKNEYELTPLHVFKIPSSLI